MRHQRMKYPLAMYSFSEEEIDAAKAVLDSRQLTLGEKVAQFEVEFAKWIGSPYAVMVNSGSSANLVIVESLLRRSSGEAPCKPGDEVLVPALAWPTTVWPLLQLGLVPVLVDIDPRTLALDLKSAASALTKRTKAIFLIHVLGFAAEMALYEEFCRKHGLLLLEDCCESLGAHNRGKHVGTFGTAGSFSLYFSHHLSAVEGGMVAISDEALRNDLLSFRSHGWIRGRSDDTQWKNKFPSHDPRFLFITSGYNVRPTELYAAIALVQLKKIEAMLSTRERLAAFVHSIIKERLPWLELIGSEALGEPKQKTARRHSWMTLPFRVRSGYGVTAQDVQAHLEARGVETRTIIAGNFAAHPAAKSLKLKSVKPLTQSEAIFQTGFMIGCHPSAAPEVLALLTSALSSLETLTPRKKSAA